MLQNTINTQDMQELSILPEYQELKKQYKQLSIKYKVRTAKYKLLKKNFLLCLLYTSPSPRDRQKSRMPSSA